MELNHVYFGENLDILRTFPDSSIDALVVDPPGALEFMNQEWDGKKGGRAQWIAWLAEIMQECLRVMKPGAHGLVWALPRTSHWTMCALEDADFEIRDVIHHIFASGLPKGQDISKVIDKHFSAVREAIGQSRRTAPTTSQAVQWEGWNTFLKPSVEYWILVRKPLAEPSIMRQVLTTGTGALNINACRVEAHDTQLSEKFASVRTAPQRENSVYGRDNRPRSEGAIEPHPGGRWPAHLVLSHAKECAENNCATHCPVAVLDTQKEEASIFFTQFPYEGIPRFYFMPKASSSDKTMKWLVKNDHPTPKSTHLMSWLNKLITPPGGVILDCFCGSGSTLVAAKRDGFSFIGIDNKKEYVDITEHRLATLGKS